MFDKKTKNQKNIPHCHFTKIDLNEKITLFAKLLLGKLFNQVGQDLSLSKSPIYMISENIFFVFA